MVKLRVQVPLPDLLSDQVDQAFGLSRKERAGCRVWKDLRVEYGFWRYKPYNLYTAKTETGRLWLLMNMPAGATIVEDRP